MFRRIAPRYDLMNRLMTGGQDVRWRQEVIRLAQYPPGGTALDLGAGTGDLAREAIRQAPACRPVAADFTLNMMLVGKQPPGPSLAWAGADALHLPFPNQTFDALVSGFLLRNVVDLPRAQRTVPRAQTGRADGCTGYHPAQAIPAQPVHPLSHAPGDPFPGQPAHR